MKIRAGFVSNSSSSSFAIDLFKLTKAQVFMIKRHSEDPDCGEGEAWYITVDGDDLVLRGSVSMDNFDMEHFLVNKVEVDPDNIEWY